mmetsp:Transcript_9645/g.39507  ORF Transcript_9645/g.39507 Transcript_9645/m.39507 type:complete len:251 (-) Transcript_9645:302-1054(-)
MNVTLGWIPLSSDETPSSLTILATQSATPRYLRPSPTAVPPHSAPCVISRVFTTSSGVVTAPVTIPATAPRTADSCCLRRRARPSTRPRRGFSSREGFVPPDAITGGGVEEGAAGASAHHASLSCSYDANSIASNGRSLRRNDPNPAKSPAARRPSFVTMWRSAARALENCPVCMRVLTTSVGTRTSEEARPAEAAAARCATTVRRWCAAVPSPSPSLGVGNSARFAGSYTAKKSAHAGTTPTRLPPRPL